MRLACSSCGHNYPEQWQSITCSFCGGPIDRRSAAPQLINKDRYMDQLWTDWQRKLAAAPPKILNEEEWLKTCAAFNGCSICGIPDIDVKTLFVPGYLGGKLYTFNVLPTCNKCAVQLNKSRRVNPFRALFNMPGMQQERLNLCIRFLETRLIDAAFETFDFNEDALEIIITCTEDTSIERFNGIYARRIFDDPKETLELREKHSVDKREEFFGVTWRLL